MTKTRQWGCVDYTGRTGERCTLVTVDHGVDHVLPSVLQGLVEERGGVLVQDERCAPC